MILARILFWCCLPLLLYVVQVVQARSPAAHAKQLSCSPSVCCGNQPVSGRYCSNPAGGMAPPAAAAVVCITCEIGQQKAM
jgi:hypothetical protein